MPTIVLIYSLRLFKMFLIFFFIYYFFFSGASPGPRGVKIRFPRAPGAPGAPFFFLGGIVEQCGHAETN